MLKASNYSENIFSFKKDQIDYFIGLLNSKKPKFILEYWCWITTKILDDYVKNNSKANYISIEHDKKYKLNEHVHIFELEDDLNINWNMYKWLENYIQSLNIKFDFVIVDGPFWWNPKYDYTRLQMVDPLLFDKLAERWFIMIHDSQRPSAIKSIEILKTLFILKWYTMLIDYVSYDEDKELMIIEFCKSISSDGERIKYKRIFNKRKSQKIWYKLINFMNKLFKW